MKSIFFAIVLAFLLLSPVRRAEAQSSSSSSSSSTQTFDTTGFPQWAKDIRRWDIIAFGSFPFAFFFSEFVYDMVRWKKANNMDSSEEGRRYAPWPIKSAGAVDKTKEEYGRTLLIAAGVSVTIAFTDLIIVLIKRSMQRKRIERILSGSIDIQKSMYDNTHVEDPDGILGSKANLSDIFDLITAVNFINVLESDHASDSIETDLE